MSLLEKREPRFATGDVVAIDPLGVNNCDLYLILGAEKGYNAEDTTIWWYWTFDLVRCERSLWHRDYIDQYGELFSGGEESC